MEGKWCVVLRLQMPNSSPSLLEIYVGNAASGRERRDTLPPRWCTPCQTGGLNGWGSKQNTIRLLWRKPFCECLVGSSAAVVTISLNGVFKHPVALCLCIVPHRYFLQIWLTGTALYTRLPCQQSHWRELALNRRDSQVISALQFHLPCFTIYHIMRQLWKKMHLRVCIGAQNVHFVVATNATGWESSSIHG